jgi:hypothetical protein
VDYPPTAKEAKILSDYSSDSEVIKNLILLAQFTRERGTSESDFYTLSPRDLKYVLQAYEGFKSAGKKKDDSLRLALKIFIKNKYVDFPSNYEAMANRIKDIFGIKV